MGPTPRLWWDRISWGPLESAEYGPIVMIVICKLLCVALVISCVTGCSGGSESEIRGIWVLTAFDGIEVEPGVNTTGSPWVEISDVLEGNTGCNSFSAAPQGNAPAYVIDGDILYPAEVFQSLMGCEPNDAEEAFGSVFGPDGIEVTMQKDQMMWHGNGTRLEFIRADERPPGS
jgi:hypothetical protein